MDDSFRRYQRGRRLRMIFMGLSLAALRAAFEAKARELDDARRNAAAYHRHVQQSISNEGFWPLHLRAVPPALREEVAQLRQQLEKRTKNVEHEAWRWRTGAHSLCDPSSHGKGCPCWFYGP